MSELDKETRRLIVQAGVAAANHGLFAEAKTILDALPLLVKDPESYALLSAVLLYGTGQMKKAAEILSPIQGVEAEQLKQIFSGNSEKGE